MTLIRIFCVVILLVAFTVAQKNGEPYAKGEILVKIAKGYSKTAVSELHSRLNATVVETLGDLGWQRVKLSGNKSVSKAVADYLYEPGVEAIQPNYYYHLLNTPNDPQWGTTGLYGLPKISAPQAWDLSTGSSSVVVANIDTGMRYTHEDLAPNMWTNPGEIQGNGIDDDGNGFADDYYGYDFFFNDPDPIDEHGHGTHTGGTIGAAGNNLLGVVGVNWAVKIMAIKIYDSTPTDTTSAMLINAYNYVRLMKNRGVNIRVTNNSYCGCDEACGYDQATKDAIDAMGDVDILNVFAAGNDARNIETTPSFPASYTSPSVLSVASSTNTDARSSFSNWGANSVDLAAPGSSILSTTRGSNSSYGPMSGTSMATPHVTGAAALLAAYNPALSAASIKATLMNTVDPLIGWSATPTKTNGRLNVFHALQNQTVCTFSLSSSTVNVITKGGYNTVTVTAGTNCDYSIKSNARWIRVESPDSLSGNGLVTFRVGVNPTITRTGTITVGGQTLTVRQSRLGFL
ncbi:MAG TPA: S8 family serine peptidase [Pyrinomonadaceae bacterium]|nr:S8 family serine peptidase [Pyrinomonadaceae bacterium]